MWAQPALRRNLQWLPLLELLPEAVRRVGLLVAANCELLDGNLHLGQLGRDVELLRLLLSEPGRQLVLRMPELDLSQVRLPQEGLMWTFFAVSGPLAMLVAVAQATSA